MVRLWLDYGYVRVRVKLGLRCVTLMSLRYLSINACVARLGRKINAADTARHHVISICSFACMVEQSRIGRMTFGITSRTSARCFNKITRSVEFHRFFPLMSVSDR